MGIYAFGISFFIALIMGLIAVFVFRGPLGRMLGEACETEARSHFWRTYLSALFVLVPVVAASGYTIFAQFVNLEDAILLEGAFLVAAAGLLFALITVGRNITQFVGPMVADTSPPETVEIA